MVASTDTNVRRASGIDRCWVGGRRIRHQSAQKKHGDVVIDLDAWLRAILASIYALLVAGERAPRAGQPALRRQRMAGPEPGAAVAGELRCLFTAVRTPTRPVGRRRPNQDRALLINHQNGFRIFFCASVKCEARQTLRLRTRRMCGENRSNSKEKRKPATPLVGNRVAGDSTAPRPY